MALPRRAPVAPVDPIARLRRKTLILAGLLLAALLLCLPAAWSRFQDWRLEGMKAPQLESLVQRHPLDVRARYRLGLVYAEDGRYREATHEFLAVLDRDPVRADVLNDLGVSYMLQERYYEALVALQGALVAKPDFAAAYANLGRLHLATKMAFTAEKELSRAVKLDPKNAAALCDLGVARHQIQSFKGAEAAYRQALELSPKLVRAYAGLGGVYTSMGRRAEAEQALAKALQIAPSDAASLVTLGDARMETAASPDDLKAVRKLYEEAARTDASNPDLWYSIGRCDLRLGRAATAIADLERALVLSPQHMGALHQLERALRAAGRKSDADRVGRVFRTRAFHDREESRLEDYIARAPQDWDAKARLTELYLESGKRGLAALVYRQLKEGRPDDPRLPAFTRALNPPTVPALPPHLMDGGAAAPSTE